VEAIQRESEMATPLLTQSRLYTPEEVAELLRVEVREVLAYIREKRLLASRLGGQYRIPADAVEDLVIANADPDAYERFLSSRIQRAQEQNLGWDPAEVERDVVNALLAVRYGRPA
jgi:excisionase family DNA binding protein